MNILCFDTCLNKTYVNLNETSKIVENTESKYHSAFLISTIKDILIENGLTSDDIDIIATNVGPGSFTGIRACVTVARVFAQAKDINVCPVSSLEILSKLSDKKRVFVGLDARKNSVYAASYEFGECIIKPQVMSLADFEKIFKEYDEVITDDYLASMFSTVPYQSINSDLGAILYEIAKNKPTVKWSMLEPLYLQPPPVSLKK